MTIDILLALLRTLVAVRTLVVGDTTWTYADGVATAVGPWTRDIDPRVPGFTRHVRTIRVDRFGCIENRYYSERARYESEQHADFRPFSARALNASSDGHRREEFAAILGLSA